MSENLKLWDQVRDVPDNAKKPINGGRLKGKTDINPMWRIKVLTEQFGQCGIGWYYKIVDKRFECGANGEIAVFVDIELFVKNGDTWSAPIYGTGGNTFVAKEKTGLYTNDEAVKMALTDAISVSCKALGIGADVYWSNDTTKYSDIKDLTDAEKDKLQAELSIIAEIDMIDTMEDLQKHWHENKDKFLDQKELVRAINIRKKELQ